MLMSKASTRVPTESLLPLGPIQLSIIFLHPSHSNRLASTGAGPSQRYGCSQLNWKSSSIIVNSGVSFSKHPIDSCQNSRRAIKRVRKLCYIQKKSNSPYHKVGLALLDPQTTYKLLLIPLRSKMPLGLLISLNLICIYGIAQSRSCWNGN